MRCSQVLLRIIFLAWIATSAAQRQADTTSEPGGVQLTGGGGDDSTGDEDPTNLLQGTDDEGEGKQTGRATRSVKGESTKSDEGESADGPTISEGASSGKGTGNGVVVVTRTGTPPGSSTDGSTNLFMDSESSKATRDSKSKETEAARSSSTKSGEASEAPNASESQSPKQPQNSSSDSSKEHDEDDDDTVVGPLNLGAFIGICVGGVVLVSLVIVCFVLRRRGRKMAASSEAEYWENREGYIEGDTPHEAAGFEKYQRYAGDEEDDDRVEAVTPRSARRR